MSETPRQELRRLRWIAHHVLNLSPAGVTWLRSWLTTEFRMDGSPRDAHD